MKKLFLILAVCSLVFPAAAFTNQDILNLVPANQASVTALASGAWNSGASWNSGMPGNGSRVHIPAGITITLNHEDLARIEWLRIDGTLRFDPAKNTRLILETVVISQTGTLEIGTSTKPVDKDKSARIVIRTDRDINSTNDPYMLGRGIISLGKVEMHGAAKSSFIAVTSGLKPGNNKLLVKDTPSNWGAGDQLILTGVRWNEVGSYADNSKNQDEILEITSLSGKEISFKNIADQSDKLKYDHQAPKNYGLSVYLANASRNIIIETENYSTVVSKRRGHMLFKSNQTKIQWVSLVGLGRSDKSLALTKPDGKGNGLTNPDGRYPLQIHMTGPSTKVDPVTVTGCALFHAPGWGYVNDSSYVNFRDNVSFDVFGAHYVSAKGAETGGYVHNIAIKSNGITKSGTLTEEGIEGEGFYFFSSSGLQFSNNVAASVRFTGIFVYGGYVLSFTTRPWWSLPVEYLSPELQKLFPGEKVVDGWRIPFREFSGNEFYNCQGGMLLRGNLHDRRGLDVFGKSHSKYTEIYNCKVWSTTSFGIWLDHTANIKIINSTVVAYPAVTSGKMFYGVNWPNRTGIYVQKNCHYIHIINDTIAGYGAGIGIPQTLDHGIPAKYEAPVGQGVLSGGVFSGNEQHFRPCSAFADDTYDIQVEPYPPFTLWYEMIEEPVMEAIAGNTPPLADFNFKPAPGMGIQFDGSLSKDTEYKLSPSPVLDQNDNNIPIFSWDFGDGIKGFGRDPIHNYNCDGTYQVSLTVYDSHGAKSKKTKTVTVKGSPFPNIVRDIGFDSVPAQAFETTSESAFRGPEWIIPKNGRWNVTGGKATTLDNTGGGGMVQVIFDQSRLYKGKQQVKFDAINQPGTGSELNIRIWGIKGNWFNVSNFNFNPPVNGDNYLPAQIVELLNHNVAQSSAWKTVTLDMDFKNGYDYILIKLWTKGPGTKGFDNIFIGNSQYNNSGCTCLLSATLSSTPDNGNKTGTATALPVNGTPPYTYKWSDSGQQTTQTVTGLPSGIYMVTITDAKDCEYTATVKIDLATGLEDLKNDQHETMIVSPNPARDRVTILLGEKPDRGTQLIITDLFGRRVYRSQLTESFLNVDISGMASGLYNIFLISDKITLSRKLVINSY